MNILKLTSILFVLWLSTVLVYFAIFTYKKQKLFDIGTKAYIYAYPLVLMDVTQKTMTKDGKYKNTFINISEFPTDTFKNIVRPNVDTLYSFAWLDLSDEPLLLSVPDTNNRYYLIEFLDAWTNVFESIGKRTTGTKAQEFIIVGPNWNGNLPNNFKKIQAPTNMVLLLGRTQTYNKKDYNNVHRIQAGYKLTPIQNVNKKLKQEPIFIDTKNITIDMAQAPVDKVDAMDATTFYNIFMETLSHNPPAKVDMPVLNELRKVGIEQYKVFNPSKAILNILNDSAKAALRKIIEQKKNIANINGWAVMLNIGSYGTDYMTRAMVAYIGIGANLPQDAIYPTTFTDSNNNQLNGKNNYRIHFNKNQLPPANAFWSITLYDEKSFLVKNSLNRYSINDRDPLHFNSDGSLDIYIQNQPPAKNIQNWLPAPQADFNITLRLYWPKQSVLDSSWQPPAIEKIKN